MQLTKSLFQKHTETNFLKKFYMIFVQSLTKEIKMKNLLMISLILLLSLPFQASTAETVSESMQDLENDARREANQKINRLEEATCMKSETECLKLKAKNRLQESTDAATDKYEEVTNVIDDD